MKARTFGMNYHTKTLKFHHIAKGNTPRVMDQRRESPEHVENENRKGYSIKRRIQRYLCTQSLCVEISMKYHAESMEA